MRHLRNTLCATRLCNGLTQVYFGGVWICCFDLIWKPKMKHGRFPAPGSWSKAPKKKPLTLGNQNLDLRFGRFWSGFRPKLGPGPLRTAPALPTPMTQISPNRAHPQASPAFPSPTARQSMNRVLAASPLAAGGITRWVLWPSACFRGLGHRAAQ